MTNWIEKCEKSNPVTREYAQSLVEKNRPANAQVTQQLIGMLLRGDALKSGAPKAPPPPMPQPPTQVMALSGSMPGPDDDTGDGDAEGD